MARMNRENRPIPIQMCLKIVFIKKNNKNDDFISAEEM